MVTLSSLLQEGNVPPGLTGTLSLVVDRFHMLHTDPSCPVQKNKPKGNLPEDIQVTGCVLCKNTELVHKSVREIQEVLDSVEDMSESVSDYSSDMASSYSRSGAASLRMENDPAWGGGSHMEERYNPSEGFPEWYNGVYPQLTEDIFTKEPYGTSKGQGPPRLIRRVDLRPYRVATEIILSTVPHAIIGKDHDAYVLISMTDTEVEDLIKRSTTTGYSRSKPPPEVLTTSRTVEELTDESYQDNWKLILEVLDNKSRSIDLDEVLTMVDTAINS